MAPQLTSRESEILRGLCEGRTTKEIAGALGIAESTVHSHVASTLRKLDAASRAEAVFKAFRAGLLDDAPAILASARRPLPRSRRRRVGSHPLVGSSRRAAARLARAVVAAVLAVGIMLAATEAAGTPLFRIGPIELPGRPAVERGR